MTFCVGLDKLRFTALFSLFQIAQICLKLNECSLNSKARAAMASTNERLDRLVLEARRSAEKREQGYRAQALKLFPWVCGRCARSFEHANLQLLEVHHKNNNHHDNPPDGSNWELLCTYCHENEHSKLKDMEGRSDGANAVPTTTFKAFADLKSMLASKK